MRIGLYIVFSLLFIIAVAVGVYMINPATYSFEVFGINMPKLPVAVWTTIPVALLAIASIFHMSFYSTKNFFAFRKWKSDVKKLEDAIYWSLIKEPNNVHFSNKELSEAASLLAESYIEPLNIEGAKIPIRLKEVAKVIIKIDSGEYVDLKNQKFAKHLSKNNPIIIKNDNNHLNADPSFALKVLDFKDKYTPELVEKALDKLVENQDFFTIKKYAKEIGKERFFKLLDRVKNGEDIGFSKDMLKSFISEYNLECKDYYKLATVTLSKFEPDENLALFKEFAKDDEKATPSYLYLLFKYEMLDKVKDILEEHSEDEYKAFRALYSLKKSKFNYKTGDVITIDNICK